VRTTVTFDPDVNRRSAKSCGNAAYRSRRRSTMPFARERAEFGPPARKPFVQKTYNMGFKPAYNWDKPLAISDAIEDEELMRRMR
jgi:hypothetical protein